MPAPAASSTETAVAPSARRVKTRRQRRSFGDGSAFRPDIQALRALAVMSVVLFHLWPNRLTGGFVGVDVFFVISGYLITSHLLKELDATGTIRLGRFWARRAKRLLPAALLVLAATTVASIIWLPAAQLPQTLREVIASVFYVENWALAFSSVDYMAADNIASPVQHFWTLSVEEQFYILLPLVLILVAWLARRTQVVTAPAVIAALVTAGAASLAYSVWLTAWSQSTAYFSTFTRLWEFIVGGLVALLPLVRGAIRPFAVAGGLGMIAAAVLAYGPGTAFPGYAAALPVLGTALVLWLGADTFARRVGDFAPVRLIGRTSYAIYLWHWAPIVLLPYATGHPLTTVEKVGILAATLAVAWLTTVHWEDRIRFSPRLLGKARPRVVAAWMAASMLVVASIPATALIVADREATARAEAASAIAAAPPPCFGAASMVDPGCADAPVWQTLVPAPLDAPQDLEPRPDCFSNGDDATLKVCTIGDPDEYTRRLLVVGDSHAKALIAALELLADERGWRIDLASRASCYWTSHDLLQKSQQLTDACARWRASLGDYIAGEQGVDAIVAVKARRALTDETATTDADAAFAEVVDGMVAAWDARPDKAVPVVALVDNPRFAASTVDCVVEAQLAAAEACAEPVSELFPADGVREAAASASNAHVVDLTDLYCEPEVCRPVIGGVVVYRDGRHLTDTYARTIAPYLGDEIDRVLAG